jgi:hypothetical protein
VRTLLLVLPVAAFLVLIAAGCGGIDKGKLESAIKSQTNDQLEKAGESARVSTVDCTKRGDSYHYDCDLQDANGKTLLRVRARCTTGGTCKWRRSS